MSDARRLSSVGPASASCQEVLPMCFAASVAQSAANSRLTPGSLKRLAMVGNTGSSASAGALGMVAPPLLAHIAQAVLRPAFLALVEHDEIGEVEHLDLLELTRRPVF